MIIFFTLLTNIFDQAAIFPTSPSAKAIKTLKIMRCKNAQFNSMESIYRVTEDENCLQTVYKVQERNSYFIDISPEKRSLVYLIELKILRQLIINLFQNAFSRDVRRRRDHSKLKLNYAHSECAIQFHRIRLQAYRGRKITANNV